MFRVRGTLCSLFCALLFLGSISFSISTSKAEVIYENLTTPQSAFVSEMREHGDQIDLGGTARRLSQIVFYYYADFVPTGDEVVKVRLYNNLTPYDDFRKSPTTLLYESDWISITPGTATRQIDDLNILLPLDNVTFTVEFKGLLPTEQAGLLFYDPPTEGYSFNEFWIRTASGVWRTINYPSVPGLRANLAIRLLATNDVKLDQQQTAVTTTLPLRTATTQVRYAQTFTPSISGLLSHINLDLNFATTPVRVRILDTIDGRPGPHVLGARNLIQATTIGQQVNMTALSIFLEKDKQYAIELSTAAESSATPSYLLAAGPNNYGRGALWTRSESGGSWTKTSLPNSASELDAAFQVHMVAAQPFTRLLTPSPNQSFDLGEPIVFRAQVGTPPIGTLTRVRFMEGTNQLVAITNAPYEFVWTNAVTGEHKIRAIADDSFKRPFRSDILTVFVRQPAAPENDNFASRIALDGLNLRRFKPSADATTEPGEPGLRPSHAGATLWWSWTAYDSSPVTITTATGASISVFTGTSLNALTTVASALSTLRFEPQPGVTYSISIDPANDNDQVVLDLTTGFRFVGTSIRNNLPTLTFDSLNRTTWIEYSTDFSNWTRVTSSNAPSTLPIVWTDPTPATNPRRFYRIVTE